MPEIIGESESFHRKCTCKKCGGIIKYYPSEVTTETIDLLGFTTADICHITCPRCEARIYVAK